MQQCGSDEDEGDFDYYSLAVKNGASTKTDCSSGTVCCVPKPGVEEENGCDDIPGHTCMTEEVKNYRLTLIIIYHFK